MAIEAIEKYDHQKGVAFSIYARYRIGRMLNLFQVKGGPTMLSLDEAWDRQENQPCFRLTDETAESVEAQVESSFVRYKVNEAVKRLNDKERNVIKVFTCMTRAVTVTKKWQSAFHTCTSFRNVLRRMRGCWQDLPQICFRADDGENQLTKVKVLIFADKV